MMRACLVLGGIFLASGQTPDGSWQAAGAEHREEHCSINGIQIADELMNSIVFIWQGVLRCGKPGHDAAECSVDVSNAIQSVSGMINVILKTVNNCGAAFNPREICLASVTELTAAMAGVAATSSGIAEECPKTSMKPLPALANGLDGGKFNHALAYCMIDAKGLIKAVLKMSVRIADASELCKPGAAYSEESCTTGILGVLDAVGQMGQFIAGVVGYCSEPNMNQPAVCASQVLGLIRNLQTLSFTGNKMSEACSLSSAERLYLDNTQKGVKTPDTTASNSPTFALAALLPVTGIMSFVAGRRMAAFRQTQPFDSEMPAEE